MSSGTLITDLDSSPQLDGDGDLINKIMADMNTDTAPPAQLSGVISSPNPNSTFTHAVDVKPAVSHVIGHEHPTLGDFQAAIKPTLGGGGSAAWEPMHQAPPPKKAPKKSWISRIADEMKVPVLVSLIVFLFSLPVTNIIIGSYIPTFVKSTGDLTMVGLLLKSLTAGTTFWFLQRVIVPLLSL